MNLKTLVEDLDVLVSQGAMVDGVKQFFADDAVTLDYKGVRTMNKKQALEKMQAIADAVTKVNGITHHGTLIEGNESASEFTFDFKLSGNSTIYWHEIIRRTWNEKGQVVKEEYFNSHKTKI
ncbi:hypothetical protein WIW50_11925 [Flavobacteriaceae bacterium 3-367]